LLAIAISATEKWPVCRGGGKNPETMQRLSRRSFLAASAATAAAPAVTGMAYAADADVIVVGAGAAGIAAVRKLTAAGKHVIVFEASPRVGGRCITDTRIFGMPVDLGAHWIHMPELNPVAKAAVRTGLDIYPAPPGQKLRIGRRNAREGEMEDYLSALVRSRRAIEEVARKGDLPCDQALPKDLGEWQGSVEFFLGAFGCGKDLREISAVDFNWSVERDIDAFCRQGYGALLAKLAESVRVQLSVPVTRIDWDRELEVETPRGKTRAHALIITASTNVIAGGSIEFKPTLPKRQLDALRRLSLGSYDHIMLDLPGNPLGLARDDLVFEKATDRRTAALLANAGGTSLCYVDVGGSFGRELSQQGRSAMEAFARNWLGNVFGADIKKAIVRAHATQWNNEPRALGAFSAAAPGGQPSRRILMEPMRERIFFAGEAVHETLWGTVAGAWESGERAADAVLKLLSPKQQTTPSQRRRRG
jgi:monoamine oxidase